MKPSFCVVTDVDVELMERALLAGSRGEPTPNPHVGCVIAQVTSASATAAATYEVVAEGYHEASGHSHAELSALLAAGERAKGATAYVTLEPCNHEGKTPPCVDALIKAGIRRVVIGCRDPNPHVAGGGVERLEAEGIQ